MRWGKKLVFKDIDGEFVIFENIRGYMAMEIQNDPHQHPEGVACAMLNKGDTIKLIDFLQTMINEPTEI